MKGKLIDETGNRFGRWIVLERGPNAIPRGVKWICKCDCGNIKAVLGRSLRGGVSKSCGCLHKELESLPYGRASFNTLLRNYKRNARNRNLVWELSDKDFEALTNSNCYWCGSPPNKSSSNSSGGKTNGSYKYNGIDRLNNNKGYLIENCVACCEKCNRAKFKMEPEEFSDWIFASYHNIFKPKIDEIFALGKRSYE